MTAGQLPITLSPSPTFSYLWANGDTTSSTNTGVLNVDTVFSVTVTNTTTGCSTLQAVNVPVTPNVIPTFTAVAPICSGGSLSALPTTSDNGIAGTWSPALDNTTTTIYTFTPTPVAGQCLGTATLTIIVNPNTTNTTTASACDTYTWSVNGTTYTTSGMYTVVNGCDTQMLDLTITPSTTNTTTASACDTYTWSVNGTTYTTSGMYTVVNGCDTQMLDLTITPSTTNTTTASACDTYTWSVNGTTYTTSGMYTVVNACDTQNLDLTITPSTTNTTTASACGSYTWSVNGTTYTTSGMYTLVNGCDTQVLNLTINSTATPTGNATQTLLDTDTIASIIVNPTTVIWYPTLADAQAGTNALLNTTTVTATTYYAVDVSGGCPSSPFAVTIIVTLKNTDFDTLNFSYYPNPTSGILNIDFSREISEVTVTNMLGQTIMNKKTNSSNVQVDLSSFADATYFVKVVSEGKEKTVKVIKK
jgi:trimeric autotransporter adhesin